MKRWFLIVLAGWACLAQALIIYNNGLDDDAYYETPAGLPQGMGDLWGSVVFLASGNWLDASGVYLGNGYFLTAKHVTALNPGTGQTHVYVNRVPYALDLQFGTGGMLDVGAIPGVGQPVDLRLCRVLSPPALPAATLNRNSAADVSAAPAYAVGCGIGKGAPIPGQGWAWGEYPTCARRWGAVNIVGQTTVEIKEPALYVSSCLTSAFSTAYGADVANGAMGDSGSGMFQQIGGAWVLSGITEAVSTMDSCSYGDNTFYVRIAHYADAILSATTDITAGGVTVPGLWLRTHYPSAPFDSYADLIAQTAANGVNTVAECYVAGLNPTGAASRFRASIVFSNGAPHIAWSPDLGDARAYHVQGKANLAEPAWGATNNATRFFKVSVELD
ncbi:MAG: hypothetical protein FWG50_13015 [Kiritimatiellaeota bacterium]|nr:hypothetical protein [Kiritimatiellota bacterium]